MRIQELFGDLLLEAWCPGEENFQPEFKSKNDQSIASYEFDKDIRLDPHLLCRIKQRGISLDAVMYAVGQAYKADPKKFINLPEIDNVSQREWDKHFYVQAAAYPIKIVVQNFKKGQDSYYNIRSAYADEGSLRDTHYDRKSLVYDPHPLHIIKSKPSELTKIKNHAISFTPGANRRYRFMPPPIPKLSQFKSAEEFESAMADYVREKDLGMSLEVVNNILKAFNDSSKALPNHEFFLKLAKKPFTLGIRPSEVPDRYEIYTLGNNVHMDQHDKHLIVI